MLWLLQEELAASAPPLNVFSEWSIVKLTGVRVTLLAAALICWKGVFESCHFKNSFDVDSADVSRVQVENSSKDCLWQL